MKAAVGQIWASTDPRDVRLNARQERVVTDVREGYAYLHTRGGKGKGRGSFGVRLSANGSIPRHRYVAPGLDPARTQDAANRANNLVREAEELEQQARVKRAQADQLRESWMLPA